MRPIKKAIISMGEKLYALKKLHKLIFLSLLSVAFAFICFFASDISVSYNVIYNGKKLAQVNSISTYYEGKDLAASKITSENPESLMEKPFFLPTITLNGGKSTSDDVAEVILNNSPQIIKGYSVSVDSKEQLFVADEAAFKTALDARLEKFSVENGTSTFTKDVNLKAIYCASVDFADKEEESAFVDSLDVKTAVTTVKTVEIPFKTVTTKTTAKLAGYNKVTKAGVKGTKEETHDIVYLNGKVTQDKLVSTLVTKEAVNEVVTVGVGKSYYTQSEKMASSHGFVWPLNKNVRAQFITAYWGDGRNHKGLDICSPYGTATYAVKDGTVEFAGWYGGYGYSIVINHGNGLKTRYAHSSKLLVKAGEKVTAGQTIALVGSTGNSTGNHLHFEVLLNGRQVNPYPYLVNS